MLVAYRITPSRKITYHLSGEEEFTNGFFQQLIEKIKYRVAKVKEGRLSDWYICEQGDGIFLYNSSSFLTPCPNGIGISQEAWEKIKKDLKLGDGDE